MIAYSQSKIFCIFFVIGLFIGFIFDIFRAFRKNFRFPDIIVSFEDMLFLLIVGALILRSIIIFNDGNLRAYIFLAIFGGISTYALTLSNMCVIIMNVIFKCLKKICIVLKKILELPYIIFNKIFKEHV